MQDRRRVNGLQSSAAASTTWPLQSSKMLVVRFQLLSRGPVVIYLFIELSSLDWRQTAAGSILSHTQKRVVKDMILIFGFR
jgi:hypothetical protein